MPGPGCLCGQCQSFSEQRPRGDRAGESMRQLNSIREFRSDLRIHRTLCAGGASLRGAGGATCEGVAAFTLRGC